jgi:hypothetical protein
MTEDEMYQRLNGLVNTADRLSEVLGIGYRPLGLQPAQELLSAIGDVMARNRALETENTMLRGK